MRMMGTLYEVNKRVQLLEDTKVFTDESHSATVVIPAGTLGTITDNDDEGCRYDEVPGPYRVMWDTGQEFTCFHSDIVPAQPAAPAPETATGAGEAGAIEFDASELTRLGYELGRYGASTEDKAEAVTAFIRKYTATLQAELAASRERERVLAAAVEPLLKRIEVLMPIREPLEHEHGNYSRAYCAFQAGEIIRAYFKATESGRRGKV